MPGFACGLGPAADVRDGFHQVPAALANFRRPSPEGVGRFRPAFTTVRWFRLPYSPAARRHPMDAACCGRSRRLPPGPCRSGGLPPTFTRGRWPVSTRFGDRSLASTAVRVCGWRRPVDAALLRTFPAASTRSPTLWRTFTDLHPRALAGFDPLWRPFTGFDCRSRLRLASPGGRCPAADVPDGFHPIPAALADFHRPSPEGVGRFRPALATVHWFRLPFASAARLRPEDWPGHVRFRPPHPGLADIAPRLPTATRRCRRASDSFRRFAPGSAAGPVSCPDRPSGSARTRIGSATALESVPLAAATRRSSRSWTGDSLWSARLAPD